MYSTADGTLCKYFSESHTTNNTESPLSRVAIYFYPLTIVPKQKRATEKPRETTVESVDIVPAKLHIHTPIIAPIARIWGVGFDYSYTESHTLPLSLFSGDSGQVYISLDECNSADLDGLLGAGAYIVLYYTCNESSISISAEPIR